MLRLSYIGFLVVMLILPVMAEASVCLRLSFDNLVDQADWVVVAHLETEGVSVWGPKHLRIFTTYRFKVTEQIAGTGPEVFTIVQPGGRMGHWQQIVKGYPSFQKSVPVMMFLRQKGASFQVVGLSQGLFSFRKDELGQEVLHQETQGLSLVVPNGYATSHDQNMVLTPAFAKKKIKELWRAKEAS